jgi:DNA-binding phage protein
VLNLAYGKGFFRWYKQMTTGGLKVLKERMEELGLEFSDLNRRYCALRQAKGDAKATPNNRRSALYRVLEGNGGATLDTFLNLVEALGGEVNVVWYDKKVQEELIKRPPIPVVLEEEIESSEPELIQVAER